MSSITTAINALLPDLIEFRHDLHQHPEIGYKEVRTSRKVVEALETKGGFDIQTEIAETGVVAVLGKDKTGQCIALRADMDCLPIHEETGKDYASKTNGYMHACGHDGHTTNLLGAALVLADHQDKLKGPVKFVFQPAEEGGAGGKKMVEAGVLENPRVDAMLGLHGWPDLPLGIISYCKGPMLANSDSFDITIHGSGGHAAFPHATVDPIVIASQVVTALQSIVSRNVSPMDNAVISVSKIEGGSTFNVIPENVTMLGTVRTLSIETQDQVFAAIERTTKNIAKAMGGKATVNLIKGYPVLVNDDEFTDYCVNSIKDEVLPAENIIPSTPIMGGEDFAYFAKEVPSTFLLLGMTPEGVSNPPRLHQSTFDFNDDALPLGIHVFCETALKFNS